METRHNHWYVRCFDSIGSFEFNFSGNEYVKYLLFENIRQLEPPKRTPTCPPKEH